MPDRYNFDWLKDWGSYEVACIEENCDAKGPAYHWPKKRREAHWSTHERARRQAEIQIRRRAQQERIARLQLANRLRAEAREAA